MARPSVNCKQKAIVFKRENCVSIDMKRIKQVYHIDRKIYISVVRITHIVHGVRGHVQQDSRRRRTIEGRLGFLAVLVIVIVIMVVPPSH